MDRSSIIACYKCEEEIADTEYDECDNCENVFHWQCMNVRKKDSTARVGSKCLRLYCPDCCDNTVKDKLKEITKLLYKLDLFNQKQKEDQAKKDDVMESFKCQLKAMELKLNALEVGDSKGQTNKKSSYANIVKEHKIKPAVIVKPKTKQANKKTHEEIANKIDKNTVKVCGTRNARDGGVVLRCEDRNDALQVKDVFNEKMGEDYDVILPKAKLPRLRITNVDPDIARENILMELKNYNDSLVQMNIKLVAVIGKKYNDNAYNDVIIEVDVTGYKQLIDMGKLKLPWRECKIIEHLYIVRCYSCCGFFHKSVDCTIKQKCHKCSGHHKFSDCKTKIECCINCKLANVQFHMKLDTKHSAWSKNCPVLKHHQMKLANKISYIE